MSRKHAVAISIAAVLTAVAAGVLAAGAAAAGGDGSRAADSSAGKGSILYRKSGKLWVASPNGKHKHRIPHTKGLENPSQDNKGRIVAQRGINLYHLDRSGEQLNKPFTTPFRTNPILPAFKGPFWPEVSPNGKTIVYTYSFSSDYYDPGCDCLVTYPSLNTAYTRSSRPTNDPASSLGLERMYSKASWIDNQRTLMTTEALYDFAGNALDTVVVDPLGGGADSYQHWFTECVACSDFQNFQKSPLDEGEATRQLDKAVFVAGELGATQAGSHLFIYTLTEPPTALPPRYCRIAGPSGRFTSPSWSPDGRSLAWVDDRGIWVGQLGDLSGDSCQVNPKLVIRGGESPDWGPARP